MKKNVKKSSGFNWILILGAILSLLATVLFSHTEDEMSYNKTRVYCETVASCLMFLFLGIIGFFRSFTFFFSVFLLILMIIGKITKKEFWIGKAKKFFNATVFILQILLLIEVFNNFSFSDPINLKYLSVLSCAALFGGSGISLLMKKEKPFYAFLGLFFVSYLCFIFSRIILGV